MENLKDRYVKPHTKTSREVTNEDIPRVLAEAEVMLELCSRGRGLHKQGGLAIAHPQIDDKDPLRFFVMRDGTIVVNPLIVDDFDSTTDVSNEGCLSFPDLWENTVERKHKIQVTYQKIENVQTSGEIGGKMEVTGRLSSVKTANYANLKARVFQHEIDHMDAKYVWPQDGLFKKAIGKIKEAVGV